MPTARSTLDPKLDVVFSMLFGHERNRDLLLGLLNAVLMPSVPIVHVEVLPQRPDRLNSDDKGIVLDVRVQLATGEQVDVEMQTQNRPALPKRLVYYWATLFAGQLERGDDYTSLRRCIVIAITDFCMLESARFHSLFQLRARGSDELLTECVEVHVLELPKLHLGEPENDGPSALLWGRFFRAETDEELEVLATQEPALKRAKEALEALSADPEARQLAERRAMGMRLYRAELAEARLEGKDAGRAEGEAVGLAKGEALGLAKGILVVLAGRRIAVDDAARARLAATEDIAQLLAWLKLAPTVARVEQLFETSPTG